MLYSWKCHHICCSKNTKFNTSAKRHSHTEIGSTHFALHMTLLSLPLSLQSNIKCEFVEAEDFLVRNFSASTAEKIKAFLVSKVC